MYCKNCFRKITPTSRFCRHCGALVENTDADTVKGGKHTQKKKTVYKNMRSDKKGKAYLYPLVIGAVAAVILLGTALILVTNSSVFQKTGSISYKDYIGVWEERGGKKIEENGGVRLEIHGRDADTLIITMEFYGVAEEDITVTELGAVIKEGKAYYSFTNDGFGNSGNGVLTFEGRDIEWESTVNKNDPVHYTMSKVVSKEEQEPVQPENTADPSQSQEQNSQAAEYILPDSDKAYVTEDELKDLTQEELRIARNEIMARHGRIFRDPTLDAYFRSKEWYKPTMEPDEFDSKSGQILNKFEMKNIALIKQMEE